MEKEKRSYTKDELKKFLKFEREMSRGSRYGEAWFLHLEVIEANSLWNENWLSTSDAPFLIILPEMLSEPLSLISGVCVLFSECQVAVLSIADGILGSGDLESRVRNSAHLLANGVLPAVLQTPLAATSSPLWRQTQQVAIFFHTRTCFSSHFVLF